MNKRAKYKTRRSALVRGRCRGFYYSFRKFERKPTATETARRPLPPAADALASPPPTIEPLSFYSGVSRF